LYKTFTVSATRTRRHSVKVMSYADCLPMLHLFNQIHALGHKVVGKRRCRSVVDGLVGSRNGEIVFTIESVDIWSLPYTNEYHLQGEKRIALLSVPGRPVLCLRCYGIGHRLNECKAPFSRKCHIYSHGTEYCTRGYSAARAGGLRPQKAVEWKPTTTKWKHRPRN